MIVKALTLWQPYAQLIADLRKLVETRPRPWYYKGPLAIHAGQTVMYDACDDFGYDHTKLIYGAVICIVDMYDTVMFPSEKAKPDPYGDFEPGRFGYLFRNVRVLAKPIPARGKQGPWNWDTPFTLKYR